MPGRRVWLCLCSLFCLFSLFRPAPAKGQTQVPATPPSVRAVCDAWQEDAEPTVLYVSLPASGPALRYQDGEVRLLFSRPFMVEEDQAGRVEVFPATPTTAAARVPMEEASVFLREQAAGRLRLVVGFQAEPGGLTATPCLRFAGGQVVRVRARPLWVSLRLLDRERARLYTEAGTQRAPEEAQVGTRPDAQVIAREVVFDGEADAGYLAPVLPPLSQRALSCYGKALSRHPGLSGKVVVGAEIDHDGRVVDPRIEINATSEPGLSRCLMEALGSMRPGRPRLPGHVSVPITLRLVPR